MTVKYVPTRHQPAFAARMDLEAAQRNSRSFRRFVHAVGLLLG
ncbi:hypothetical protein [Tsukamurella soli]